MIRWSYVASRVAVTALILGVIWAMMNPLLRLGLIYTGQSATGARLDIASVRTLLTRSRIDVADIQVADPDSPMSNLAQIGHASFDVETSSVLKKRLVIREGRLSNIQFHTERENSGQIKQTEQEKSSKPGALDRFGRMGDEWFDASVDRLEQKIEEEFVSVRLARELEDRWPQEYDRLEQESEALSVRGKRLVDEVEAMSERPLGHLDRIQQTLQEADRLRRDGLRLKTKLTQLKQQMAKDRVAIREAKEHDVRKIRQTFNFKELDASQLSEYLLGPEIHQKVSTALGWVQWSRQMMSPSDPAEATNAEDRGRDVIFPCMVNAPDLLIRKLIVDGRGTVDGKAFRFDGVVGDLTHQPRRHEQPTTFTVRTDGAIQLIAKAVLDRRGSQPTEHIVIDIPALSQAARTLGDADKLAVSVSPGKAQVRVDLKLRGDDVAGVVDFRQNDVKVTPQLKQAYSKEILAANADSAFDTIDRIHATVRLGGKIKQPSIQLQSNLGPQLAAGMNAAIQTELEARERQLTAQADAEVQRRLARFEERLMQRHGDVLKKLELGDKELSMIKHDIASRIGAPADVMDKGKELLKIFRR